MSTLGSVATALPLLRIEGPIKEWLQLLSTLMRGGGCPTVLNAANETAVHAFLYGRIGFLDIVETVERTLEVIPEGQLESLDDVYNFDRTARAIAGRFAGRRNSTFGNA